MSILKFNAILAKNRIARNIAIYKRETPINSTHNAYFTTHAIMADIAIIKKATGFNKHIGQLIKNANEYQTAGENRNPILLIQMIAELHALEQIVGTDNQPEVYAIYTNNSSLERSFDL